MANEIEIILKTKRTYLRRWQRDDLDSLNLIFGSHEVMDSVGNGGALNRSQVSGLLDFFLKQYNDFGFGPMAVVRDDTHQIIGVNGIKKLSEFSFPDIGFAFLKSEWGRGLAYETSLSVLNYFFSTTKLTDIIALVHPDNTRSLGLLKKMKFGFSKNTTRNGFSTDIYQISRSAFLG